MKHSETEIQRQIEEAKKISLAFAATIKRNNVSIAGVVMGIIENLLTATLCSADYTPEEMEKVLKIFEENVRRKLCKYVIENKRETQPGSVSGRVN